MQKALSPLLQIGLCTLGCLYASSTQAQVTPDGTVNTQVNQNGSIAEITGGETRGSNLFHSFQDFSVPTGNEAFFNNVDSISNILSRVTGGNISNIDGLIRANGSANLFLINPAGIVFGQNARLDIGGSFLGSTADSILFEDGEFSAVDNLQQPILTINAPIGLGFRDNPAPIENSSTTSADFNPAPSFDDNLFGLRVPDGKTFGLAGGDITADGGGIVAVGGRIELGAVGESGTLGINFENDNLSFNFPDDLARANVSLTDNAGFLVSGNGGGDIAITANNIEILEGSGLFAGIFRGLGSPNVQADDISLNASDSINIDRNSRVTNNVGNFNNFGGIGNSGNITIETGTLSISNGGLIGISTFGAGNTGSLSINASESIEIDGFDNFSSGIFADVTQNAIGNTGNITIETGQFSLSNGAQISANAFGQGNTGNININTEQFNLSDGAQILTGVFGVGDSGNLTVNASESINISGIENNFGGLSAQLSETGRGNGGNVTLNTQIFNLNNNGQISASNFGEGRTGDIVITATESINIENSNLFSEVDQNATGNTGNIFLETGLLDINSSSIATVTFSEVDAANVEITSQNLIIQNGSLISTRTNGNGNGGNLNLNVLETIKIKNGSGLSFDTVGSGDGGNLTIATKNLLVEEGLIFGGTLSEGTGGTLTVNASESVELINTFGEGIPGGLTTQTQSAGQAGDLTVATQNKNHFDPK
ncbi:MAG: filamentous hemagglutinin N-terminal domain-containing protein [Pleurocapsa sp. MO_226.B13]|nr:filamentous hemagglutinin N-terminal domain-containing protein [Pleurocapsa sp. MO_226.B13]